MLQEWEQTTLILTTWKWGSKAYAIMSVEHSQTADFTLKVGYKQETIIKYSYG